MSLYDSIVVKTIVRNMYEVSDQLDTNQPCISYFSSGKHVHVMNTPHTPLLNSKTGVCRAIPFFLIFDPKHTVWVLVRTALLRQCLHVPTMFVLRINIKNIKNFLVKFSIFTAEKNLCILHGHVFIMHCEENV